MKFKVNLIIIKLIKLKMTDITWITRDIPLLESMFIMDGFIGAIHFVKEYFVYKFKDDKTKDDLILKYGRLYRLNIIDRYILYTVLYAIVYIPFMNWEHSQIALGITFPFIQNSIFWIPYFNRLLIDFIEKKNCFVRYSLSKITVNVIKTIDVAISPIPNYHIFIIYNLLNLSWIWNFCRTYLFIGLLSYLRSNEVTYYYYKAIKLSYYYNTGYMFNVLTKDEAIYIINSVIKEKKWRDIYNINVTNAFYTLLSNKIDIKHDWTNINLFWLKFASLWSVLCTLKIMNIYINTFVLSGYLLILWYVSEKNIDFKRFTVAIIIYGLILLNTNDLIICCIFVGYRVIYKVLEEFVFFVKNYKNIKKVVEFYKTTKK